MSFQQLDLKFHSYLPVEALHSFACFSFNINILLSRSSSRGEGKSGKAVQAFILRGFAQKLINSQVLKELWEFVGNIRGNRFQKIHKIFTVDNFSWISSFYLEFTYLQCICGQVWKIYFSTVEYRLKIQQHLRSISIKALI